MAGINASNPLTTREAVVVGVAADWLESRPDVSVTVVDLSKTLQQLITEIFATGRQRNRTGLSAHALSALEVTDIDRVEFAQARAFAKTADMPVTCGQIFGKLAEHLVPLAIAIQLARPAVADAAQRLVTRTGLPLRRPELRGFVVSRVRQHAQELHARFGTTESADGYLRLVLRDTDFLAEQVVARARGKRQQCLVLSPSAGKQAEQYAREHISRLRAVAGPLGHDGEDAVGQALLKLVIAFRNRPDLAADFAFGRRALENAIIDQRSAVSNRWHRERPASEELELLAGVSDEGAVMTEIADTVLRRVLAAAGSLAGDSELEPQLARQALLRYFLVDPEVLDPHRAQLAQHVLRLSGTGVKGRGDEVGAGLREIVSTLTPSRAAVPRISALAIAALRSGGTHDLAA